MTDPADSTQLFGFTATYGTFSLADGDTPNDSGALLPSSEAGNYSVTEDTPLPTGWTLDDVTCTGAAGRDVPDNTAIDLQPGETVTCVFENIQDAKVRIVKEAEFGRAHV